MSLLATIVSDVRALGTSAIPRGIYETSKRSGAHALLFRTTSSSSELRSTYGGLPSEVDAEARAATLIDADKILNVGLLAFGRRFQIDIAQDWHKDPLSGKSWQHGSWWTIDIRSSERLADVKWTWELGRHRDLVVLARAHALAPDDKRWINELARLLALWLEANPVEASIHWYSNLEIALRLVAWDQIIGLAADDLPAAVFEGMQLHVAQAKRHLIRDLPYTVSSMKNNHLLGDALGIQLAYRMTGSPSTARGLKIANRLWSKQLARHMNPDGSMVEDSLSYHRFVLEMLCVRRMLGDTSPELTSALRSAGRHLEQLGVFEGAVPQFGDWDEGRVLTSSMDPHDIANSAALALALAGDPIPAEWFGRYDLLSWYAAQATPGPRAETQPVASRSTKVGRFTRTSTKRWDIWLKSEHGSSHGHADLGHISAKRDGSWLLVDPGTGTYNGPLHIRNGFRTSNAHNVLRINGADQLEPHRAFRWQRSPWGATGTPLNPHPGSPAADIPWSVNDAYAHLDGIGRSARAIFPSGDSLVIIDWTESTGEFDFDLSVPLAAGTDVSTLDFSISSGEWATTEAQEEPWRGWNSNTYGQWEPAPWIVASGRSQGPIAWQVGGFIEVAINDNRITVGGRALTVEWTVESVLLTVADGTKQEVTGVVSGGHR